MYKLVQLVDGEIVIVKEELLLVKEAAEIIHKDKGGVYKGDYDGRRKLWATKQFGLAWWITDINSPGIQAGLTGTDLFEDGKKNLDIDATWVPTDTFNDFLRIYQESYNSFVIIRLGKELLSTISLTVDSVAMIRKNIAKLLDDPNMSADQMKSALNFQRELINIASEYPTFVDKIQNALERARKEEKEIEMARGNVRITSSMIPDNK